MTISAGYCRGEFDQVHPNSEILWLCKMVNMVLVFDVIFDTVFDIITFHTLREWFTNAHQSSTIKSLKNINKI